MAFLLQSLIPIEGNTVNGEEKKLDKQKALRKLPLFPLLFLF
jgi:hypothetical protein